ncbi:MAG: hypothetical protein ACJ8F7_13235 [Gemmataceae bacterium]
MKKCIISFCSLFALVTAGFAQDTVTVRDRTGKSDKLTTVVGTITAESVAGVKVKPGVGPEKEVPAGDIVDVVYEVRPAAKLKYNSAMQNEAKKAGPDAAKSLAEAEKDYNGVVAQIGSDEKAAKALRHIQYKLALLKVAQAGEDKVKQLEAADLLGKFRREHANCWQYMPAARQQAQMLIDLDKFDSAAAVFDELAQNSDLPKAAKQEADLLAIDVLMRAKNYTAAEKRVGSALAGLKPDDPQAERLKLYQIACTAGTADLTKVEPQLKAAIDKAADIGLKALAYNTLGDVYAAKGQKQDAKWAYLWVDAVYSADRNEHLKAMERLAQVFKDLGDEDHANKYREKLARMR